MKKIVFYIAIFLLVFSCGRSGGDTPVDTSVKAPVLSYPSDSQLCTEIPITFIWASSANATKYVITINKLANGQQTQVLQQTITNLSLAVSTLDKGTLYNWNVQAVGSSNSATSSSQQFQTESVAVTNHAPFAPIATSPTDGGNYSVASGSASWSCTDPDNDTLTYDVYLGTSPTSLTVVTTGISTKSYSFSNLTVGTTYYWKVVASDNHSNKTVSQIWSFKAI